MTPHSQKYPKVSKFVKAHSEIGIRRMLAEDRRIRARAERLGLKAKHHRVIGGWSLICAETGGTIVERSFTWEVDEYLTLVQRNSGEQKLLECQLNVLKLKKALQEFAASEDRLDEMLWGAE